MSSKTVSNSIESGYCTAMNRTRDLPVASATPYHSATTPPTSIVHRCKESTQWV